MTSVAWRWRWSAGFELLVSQTVADVFRSNRQRLWHAERGGQLFVDPSYPSGLLLTLATPPHYADRAGRSWLEFDLERCLRETEIANAQGLCLVGYWHTHPQTIPKISLTDVESFSRYAARYVQNLPKPLAVIVGTSTQPEGIKAWSFREGGYVEAFFEK